MAINATSNFPEVCRVFIAASLGRTLLRAERAKKLRPANNRRLPSSHLGSGALIVEPHDQGNAILEIGHKDSVYIRMRFEQLILNFIGVCQPREVPPSIKLQATSFAQRDGNHTQKAQDRTQKGTKKIS